jgi:hypothetical protein
MLKVFLAQAVAVFGVVAKASGAERRCPEAGKPISQPITLLGGSTSIMPSNILESLNSPVIFIVNQYVDPRISLHAYLYLDGVLAHVALKK